MGDISDSRKARQVPEARHPPMQSGEMSQCGAALFQGALVRGEVAHLLGPQATSAPGGPSPNLPLARGSSTSSPVEFCVLPSQDLLSLFISPGRDLSRGGLFQFSEGHLQAWLSRLQPKGRGWAWRPLIPTEDRGQMVSLLTANAAGIKSLESTSGFGW